MFLLSNYIIVYLSLCAPICGELNSPYNDLDCYLLLLYQLLNGSSSLDMEEFIPHSTFGNIYESFWKANLIELNNLSDLIMKNWFSTAKLRIATSKLKSPTEFNHVSLFGDGHDSRVDFGNKRILKISKTINSIL